MRQPVYQGELPERVAPQRRQVTLVESLAHPVPVKRAPVPRGEISREPESVETDEDPLNARLAQH